MRSDIPTASQAVTIGVPYLTPWTQDTLSKISPDDLRFKFNYAVSDAVGVSWTITLHFAIYKAMKGHTAASGMLEKLPNTITITWAGTGNVAATTVYSDSGATISSDIIEPITDGLLYVAMLWTTTASGFPTFTINKFGNTVGSGTWWYTLSALTGQTSLPQTIATMTGAKVNQEHWISELT